MKLYETEFLKPRVFAYRIGQIQLEFNNVFKVFNPNPHWVQITAQLFGFGICLTFCSEQALQYEKEVAEGLHNEGYE